MTSKREGPKQPISGAIDITAGNQSKTPENGPYGLSSGLSEAISANGENADNGPESLETGSFVRDSAGIVRAKNGQFVTGHAPRPPAGSQWSAYRKEIVRSIPPGEIVGWIRRAAELAEKAGSARGLVAVAELTLGYTTGKPRAMRDEGEGKLDLAALLASVSDEVGAPAVDGQKGEGER